MIHWLSSPGLGVELGSVIVGPKTLPDLLFKELYIYIYIYI